MMQQHKAARKLSAEIDRLIVGASARPETHDSSLHADELAVAVRLRVWSERLPPVPTSLERRVRDIVQSSPTQRQPRMWRSAAWGALVATTVFLVVWMVVPSGQQVMAQVLRALLGQTQVELTPTLEEPTRAVREPLRDLVAAELLMGRAPSLPRILPKEYVLIEITAVSYPDLPAWISQPLFVELEYGEPGTAPGLRLREYRLLFREYGGISGIQAASELVARFEEVEVAGVPGVLLTFTGDNAAHTVIWERDGLLLELESDKLAPDHLLEIAASVR